MWESVEEDDLDALAEVAELELARRKAEEPLRYVQLNPCTRRYAEAWTDPLKRTVLFIAPNAVGKTYTTVALVGWLMWPDLAPFWFSERMLKKWGQWPKQIRLVSTAEEVAESGSFQAAVKKLWPSKRYTSEKQRKPYPSLFKTDTGFVLDVMTYDQAESEFEGGDRGLIIFNEPPPKPIYSACVARTRMGGMMVFPGTPLYDAAWIKDDLVDKAIQDDSISVIGGELEEACADHSPGGHLPHKEIVRLMNSYDPEQYEARVHGKFMHLSGVIYKSFTRDKYTSKSIPPAQIYTPFQIIDPAGFQKPFSIIWGQVVMDPPHGLRILREWPNGSAGPQFLFENMKDPSMKVEDYAKVFEEVEHSLGFVKDNVTRILDRRYGHVRDNADGKCLREHFADYGYYFTDSYSVPEKIPELRTGVAAVKNYLKLDERTKVPYLVIDQSCLNTIRALERWAVDPKTMKPKDDVWKNFADVVRYLCAAGLQYETRVSDTEWNTAEGPSWGV